MLEPVLFRILGALVLLANPYTLVQSRNIVNKDTSSTEGVAQRPVKFNTPTLVAKENLLFFVSSLEPTLGSELIFLVHTRCVNQNGTSSMLETHKRDSVMDIKKKIKVLFLKKTQECNILVRSSCNVHRNRKPSD